MAFPLLLLFVGVVSGQRAEVEQRSPGESLTVHCDYTHDYKDHQKIWCRETEPGFCNLVVRTAWSSWTLVSATSRRTHISDNKRTQQISVMVQELEEPDAGLYWCGVYFSLTNKIEIMKKIDLHITEGFDEDVFISYWESPDDGFDEDGWKSSADGFDEDGWKSSADGFPNSPERILTDSRDESQDEDNKESGENPSSLLVMTPGLVTTILAVILLSKVLVVPVVYMMVRRRVAMTEARAQEKESEEF
ncbi:uncharacterized protein LOC144755621 [Lissotriton helveticus]